MNRHRSFPTSVLTLVVLAPLGATLLSACEGDAKPADRGWAGTVDTLPGGAVLVKNPARGMWDTTSTWHLEEEVRIGSAEVEGPTLFGSITALQVDPLGRIWVLDRQAKELRVFDAQGRHVRTVGREGGGPGEFADPIGLAWSPDGNLWVADPNNARYAVFDTSGAYLSSHRREQGGYTLPWTGGFDDQGNFYEVSTALMEDDSYRRAVLRFDSAFAVTDTVFLPEHDVESFVFEGEGTSMATAVPFTPTLATFIDRRGYLWSGITDRYRIVQQRLGGDTARIVERPYDPLPITAEEREEAVEGLKWFTEQGGKIDLSRIPDTKPAFTGFFVDHGGRLWVRPSTASAEAQNTFDVFDTEGRYLGRLRSPVDIGSYPPPVFRGDRIYAVTRDELDVPYVVRLRTVQP
jgi:sugar lactone lactonase YvrE